SCAACWTRRGSLVKVTCEALNRSRASERDHRELIGINIERLMGAPMKNQSYCPFSLLSLLEEGSRRRPHAMRADANAKPKLPAGYIHVRSASGALRLMALGIGDRGMTYG